MPFLNTFIPQDLFNNPHGVLEASAFLPKRLLFGNVKCTRHFNYDTVHWADLDPYSFLSVGN